MKRRRLLAVEQQLYQTQHGKIQKPDAYGIKRDLARKQSGKQEDGSDDFDDDLDEALFKLDSDSLTTADYLIKANPNSNLPVCLVHQVYSIIPNNTMVDRELQQAFQNGLYRKIHIVGTLEDEFLLIKTSDYVNGVKEAKDHAIKSKEDPIVFDVFETVVDQYKSVSILKSTLIQDFKLTERNLAQLVSYGLLLPHSRLDSFWFSIREQGSFMSKLNAGRNEIQRMLKRRHSHDMMEKLLKQKKLHKTNFSIDFLLYDLIGSGRVERHKTPMGDLIRLTDKGGK
ncbi:serine-threonine protein kinase 19-domain-containing protein [Gilbertella persicaria]|uniref:serine-threonine protein kinase 19-domain-containing protein n=1 Tax=Gilbertella persicaria TaxID=101096 RepID=UPI00222076DE|nr:serine-threonine protein kinase 19-domain-containing protein [Gilbertella persicaria]KAI8091168.1 serine-threonine protein kinase 19-domain-containing protein [Gilbertella persicaria]